MKYSLLGLAFLVWSIFGTYAIVPQYPERQTWFSCVFILSLVFFYFAQKNKEDTTVLKDMSAKIIWYVLLVAIGFWFFKGIGTVPALLLLILWSVNNKR
jgi:hypothetical protein